MEFLLQLGEAREERPVGVAGALGRVEAVRERPQAPEGLAGILVLVHHAGDGSIDGQDDGVSGGGCPDDGEEDLFLLVEVPAQFRLKSQEDVADLEQRGCPCAVHLGDADGHGAEPGQLGPEWDMVSGLDVVREFWRREQGGVGFRVRGQLRFAFDLPGHRLGIEAAVPAGITERPTSLAAEVDLEALEDAGT